MTNKVFPFITKSINPIGGDCPHNCTYCWRHSLVKRFPSLRKRYLGGLWLDETRLKPQSDPNQFIFLCDMTDLMAVDVPEQIIARVLKFVGESKAKFLIQTKNPKRFLDFIEIIPSNAVLGSTIESNRCYPSLGESPSQRERLGSMTKLRNITNLPLFVAIEPILDFDLADFNEALRRIGPSFVVIGYDNYHHTLPEPSLEKTLRLADSLHNFTTVHEKNFRPAWWERVDES